MCSLHLYGKGDFDLVKKLAMNLVHSEASNNSSRSMMYKPTAIGRTQSKERSTRVIHTNIALCVHYS